MCGIFGVINRDNLTIKYTKEKLTDAIMTMYHRGPDAQVGSSIEENVFLGHLRLAIVDLSPESNQPFIIDGRYHLVFNGEIYNYLELKEELITLGYKFKTNSDTEVLLVAYIHWGEKCVNKFNGMWAFAIYDVISKKLFCSRDRFGVKPFIYTLTKENNFIFSSEAKAILELEPTLKQPNYNVIANFCRTSVGAQIEETWFENIYRLMPAHNLVVTADTFNIYRYWDYPTEVNLDISFEDAKKQYKELFISALKLRMRSDVPVGTTLSSGIDSNSIVYGLRTFFKGEHNVYTAYSNNDDYLDIDKLVYKQNQVIDEITVVNKVSKDLNLNSHLIEVDYKTDYLKKLTKIVYYLECGHNSPAVYPLSTMLKKAKEKVTVVLEGQGADELIGGYITTFSPNYILDLLREGNLIRAAKELRSLSNTFSLSYSLKLLLRSFNSPLLHKWYSKIIKTDRLYVGAIESYKYIIDGGDKNFKSKSFLTTSLHHNHTGILTNLIQYGDAISMQHSIESRLPFMDYRLVEFVFKMPNRYKIHDGKGKYIHREAMRGIVNDDILNQTNKFGFNTPLSSLFMKNDEDSCLKMMLSERCIERGLFDKSVLENIISKHHQGKGGYANILFRILMVELWFRVFIDGDALPDSL